MTTQFNLPDKFYNLYLLTSRWLKKFPKPDRYTLGQKLENNILEILDEIYFLNQLSDNFKESHLLSVSAKTEVLKLLFRLTADSKLIELNQYIQAESLLQECGKMINGWLNHVRQQR